MNTSGNKQADNNKLIVAFAGNCDSAVMRCV